MYGKVFKIVLQFHGRFAGKNFDEVAGKEDPRSAGIFYAD